MQFQSRFHDRIRRGDITCTVRFWKSAHVRIGGSYRLGGGTIRVSRMREIGRDELTQALARRAGFDSVEEMLQVARHGAGERIFLIHFRYVNTPARPQPHERAVNAAGLLEIARRLDTMDRRASQPWTRQTLRTIWSHPGLRSTELAHMLGRERMPLKQDIRKLKALGLTISLDVGYRLSPIGVRLLQS